VRALVVGLAATGVAVTRRLADEGWTVTVVEDAPASTGPYGERAAQVRALGATLEEAPGAARTRRLAARADLVVPSPLVRPSHPAVASAAGAGVPVRSEIDLAAERAAVPIVAVTGTNGKTTVTSMIAAMFHASAVRAVAAGNIGRPLIDAIGDPVDVVVAEVSSFQLAFAETFRPAVAVLLAVTPDHLDWHGSLEHYVASKARVTVHQRAPDVLVYDADDPRAREIAAGSSARTLAVTLGPPGPARYGVADDALVRPSGGVVAPLASMRRALLHDRTNALASAAAALEAGASPDGVRAALASYVTMRHRVELVGEANGVRWYDDSKATNPDAAVRAVASFDSVVLLAGGRNKDLDLSVLRSQAGRLRGVVAFGEAGPEVASAFAPTATPVVTVATVREGVHAAHAMACPGDAVLLSPACASFDAYAGYGERGDDFAAEVRVVLGQEATAP
jgi:UDP-N-acetylmuramoylalanine--D-glutamate ligase